MTVQNSYEFCYDEFRYDEFCYGATTAERVAHIARSEYNRLPALDTQLRSLRAPMCLIVLAHHLISGVPVLLAANREESPDRPTIPPAVVREPDGALWLGGRDALAGGTWLGVNSAGTVVGITNRSDRAVPPAARSRGLLCRELLKCGGFDGTVAELHRQLQRMDFAGFNLLVASPDEALVLEYGVEQRFRGIAVGLHVVTNSGLNDTGDLRGEMARRTFEAALESGASPNELLDVAMNVCRAAQLPLQPGRDGRPWGTVSATVLMLPDDPAEAQYHYSAGPPTSAPFECYGSPLREVLSAVPQQSEIGGQRSEIRGQLSPLTTHHSPLTTHHSATSIYRIHLKGPWEYEWLNGPAPDRPQQGRVTMPADWHSLFGPVAGRAVFRRRFHSPTNLEPDDRVWLVFDGVGGSGDVRVNGEVIGRVQSSDQPQRFEMTARLQPFNEAEIEIAFDPSRDHIPGGLYAPVAIEIESTC